MPCSICGIVGHNKKTCGKYNNTMPKDSAYYGDFKKTVQYNYNYAKQKKAKSGNTSGSVFPKKKTMGYTFSSKPDSSTSFC